MRLTEYPVGSCSLPYTPSSSATTQPAASVTRMLAAFGSEVLGRASTGCVPTGWAGLGGVRVQRRGWLDRARLVAQPGDLAVGVFHPARGAGGGFCPVEPGRGGDRHRGVGPGAPARRDGAGELPVGQRAGELVGS